MIKMGSNQMEIQFIFRCASMIFFFFLGGTNCYFVFLLIMWIWLFVNEEESNKVDVPFFLLNNKVNVVC